VLAAGENGVVPGFTARPLGPLVIPFRTGMRKRLFRTNVVSIGCPPGPLPAAGRHHPQWRDPPDPRPVGCRSESPGRRLARPQRIPGPALPGGSLEVERPGAL